LRIEVLSAQTNGVERVKRFVNVHLHCIVSNLKRISKIGIVVNFCKKDVWERMKWKLWISLVQQPRYSKRLGLRVKKFLASFG